MEAQIKFDFMKLYDVKIIANKPTLIDWNTPVLHDNPLFQAQHPKDVVIK